LSIDQICFDLTNAQFPILNSHPKGTGSLLLMLLDVLLGEFFEGRRP
jgi:hypothetical protein